MRHQGTQAEIATDAAQRVLRLRWEISPGAIRTSPLPEIAAMNGQAEKISRAVLEWRVSGEAAAATLKLEIGEDDLEVDLGASRGEWVEDGEFEHGEFGDVLRVSVRAGKPMWARTTLLERVLGLGGGVYEGPLDPDICR